MDNRIAGSSPKIRNRRLKTLTIMAYREITSDMPEYRTIIHQALINKDVETIQKIRTRYGAKIHIVSNWFLYHLIMLGRSQNYIVIYDKEAAAAFDKFEESQEQEAYHGKLL